MIMIDPALLVAERHAVEAWALQRFLDLRSELQVLVEDALEVRDALVPQWAAALRTERRAEPMALDPHGPVASRPEYQHGHACRGGRHDDVGEDVIADIAGARDLGDGRDFRHSDGSRIDPVRASVRRRHPA